MKFLQNTKWAGLLIVTLFLGSGCATAPTEEAATAEEVTEEAAEVVETQEAPDPSVAIEDAKAAIAKAKSVNGLWRDTEKFLKQAIEAAEAGDGEKAIKLANKAREQAEMSYNQALLEQAKAKLEQMKAMMGSMTSAQLDAMREAEAAIAANEGKRAYDILSQLEAEMAAAAVVYTVVTGDNLWAISAKDEIYGNPYQWPLIYKENRDQITDADLIYPGQVFNVSKNPSMDEVDAAVQHAKTRGAWTLGQSETTDLEYLDR